MNAKDSRKIAEAVIATAVIVTTVTPLIQDQLKKRRKRKLTLIVDDINFALDRKDREKFDKIVLRYNRLK